MHIRPTEYIEMDIEEKAFITACLNVKGEREKKVQAKLKKNK